MNLTLQSPEVERVARASSALLVAIWKIDKWLELHDRFDGVPPEQQEEFRLALREAGAAYGKLRAAQHGRP